MKKQASHFDKPLSVSAEKKADSPSPYRVLIEANKLLMPGNDGIKRYLTELVDSLTIPEQFFLKWEIDLYVQGVKPFKLSERREELPNLVAVTEEQKDRIEKKIEVIKKQPPFEVRMLQAKEKVRNILPDRLYRSLKHTYEYLPIRYLVRLYSKFLTQKELRRLKNTFEHYDLIHIPLPQNFHYLQNVQSKFLVTVHDLSHKYFPDFHTIDNATRAESGMQLIIQNNAHILAVSEATKADIIKEYPINPDNVHVVYGSYNHAHFRPQRDRNRLKTVLKKYNLPKCRYFLTLSTLEPRKNTVNMLKAFEALSAECRDENIALFVCGKKGWKIDDQLKKEPVSGNNIFFTGFVADEDLPVLYAHALALCYVSFYEGFGLPPLEAMACGTTVIYGNNSSMPEVIGDAGLPANPYDAENIKAQMKRLLQDKKMRASLNEKALKRALRFSRLNVALDTLQVYENII